jgi:hypothetical protein
MRRARRLNSPSNLVPKKTCIFASFIVLMMENDNDSDDDSSLEEMRSRRCHRARKFIDGSLSLFFNEGDDEQEEEEQQSYEEVRHQEGQKKSSGSMDVSIEARSFECFKPKNCSRGLTECPLKPSTR